jgi:2-polyprenyl-6-hydroxyphenyl methylase/3-demethylubiquinone-9 3-methyltransferase
VPEYGYSNAELACSSSYLLPVIRQKLEGLPPGSVVLDLGCGNGSLLAAFRRRGWALHGLEISSSGLAEARQAYPGIEFHCADLTTDLSAHPLAGRCDAVISTEVVEHLFLPRIYAQNCFHFLAPNGRLIISTPYHGYLKNLTLALAGAMDNHFTALWDCGHIKFWSRKTLASLLVEAGFAVERFVGVGRIPFLWKSMVLVARKPRRQGSA